MAASLLREFSKIVSWRRGAERAPHKPLLILYALGALSRGQEQISYSEVEGVLTELLRDYAPSRARLHPEYPFIRLQNDGIWVLQEPVKPQSVWNVNTQLLSSLRDGPVLGGFRPDIIKKLKKSTTLLAKLIEQVLEDNFPASLHQELIDRCGIELFTIHFRRSRNPEFRLCVLDAYGYQCTVCGHSMQLRGQHLALEAAHIRWHAFGGMNNVNNGLALCSTHHKLFDFGAFGIRKGIIEYSEAIVGNHIFDFHLTQFHGQQMCMPIDPRHNPLAENFDWHYSEVFKSPARK